MNAEEVAEKFSLDPLEQEGGWFKRIYTGELTSSGRPLSTTILALFTHAQYSALHRLDADEQLFYSAGDSFSVYSIGPDGVICEETLGPDLARGERPQLTMAKGTCFGGKPMADGGFGWSLIAAVVTPGFQWSGFELGRREELTQLHPGQAQRIKSLTR